MIIITEFIKHVNNVATLNKDLVSLVSAIISMMALLAALYFGSIFRQNKLEESKINLKFKQKLQSKILDELVKHLHAYRVTEIGSSCSLREMARINEHSSYKLGKVSYNIYAPELIDLEIEFINTAYKNGFIKSYSSSTATNNNNLFMYQSFILIPSNKTWDIVEDLYSRSKEKLKLDEFNKAILNFFRPPLKMSRRHFLKKIKLGLF